MVGAALIDLQISTVGRQRDGSQEDPSWIDLRSAGAPIWRCSVLGKSCSDLGPAQEKGHKLTLRAIMSELGAEYLRLANALLIDDFKGLEESAKAIQGRPLPDEIVAAIKNELGKDFQGIRTGRRAKPSGGG